MASSSDSKEVDYSTLDVSQRDELTKVFPEFMREQLLWEKTSNGKKSKSRNTVDIELFSLLTPFKDQTLLKDTSLFLEPCKRHCLYGGNGTGKTLLFERMADAGIKGFPKHLHVHHLKELEHLEVAENVIDTVVHSHIVRQALVVAKDLLEKAAATATEEQKAGIKDNTQYIDQLWRGYECDTAELRASKMLRVLGFDESGQKRSTNDLSGGLRMRVALACAFFASADLLLLDEPTNHLDFPSVLWLENRLRGYSKSFLLVTHDRDLLNNVTQSVLLLEGKKIKFFPMGFAQFEKHKAKLDEQKMKDAEVFLKRNRNVDNSTEAGRRVYDYRNWLTEYRQKLVQMAGKFTFPKATPLENKENLKDEDISIINLEKCRFSYNPKEEDPNFIFDTPIDFKVTAATRCGIMGPNGAGKSTLLKLLTKKIFPTEGTCTWHPNFTLAYFGQHSTAELDMSLTPMEFMMEQFPGVKSGLLRDHLSKTGVTGGKESTRMENISYSTRSCVIFSKLTYVCPHLLIMDEPTNFLDIASVDSLISAANKFKGALLVVTHSRHFLRKCANKYLSVVPGSFDIFDSMKEAENATYTFIQELESGGKVGASALSDTPGGGSRHPTAAQTAAKNAAAIAAGKPPVYKFEVGEQVEGLWTDKKHHPAVVREIRNTPKGVKYALFYHEFNKVAAIPAGGIKKVSAAKAAAAMEGVVAKAAVKAKAVEREAEAKKARDANKNKKWEVGDKCVARFTDGKWYAGKVEKVLPFDQFMVTYTQFNDPAIKLSKKQVKAWDPALLTKPKPAGGAAGGRGKPQGGRQQGGQRQGGGARAPRQRKNSAQAA